MNVSKIEMNKAEAKDAFGHYRNLPAAARTAEDDAIMRGYKALASGAAIIDITKAFGDTGVDEKGRPKLAIARADAYWGYFNWEEVNVARFRSCYEKEPGWRVPITKHGMTTIRSMKSPENRHSAHGRALVPLIPPQHRPKFKLSGYHILWEAEWQNVPPVDPFLLRHLGGALYVVLAQWDLTEVEQSVLAGRL